MLYVKLPATKPMPGDQGPKQVTTADIPSDHGEPNPTNPVGCTILLDEQQDGHHLQARITKLTHDHVSSIDKNQDSTYMIVWENGEVTAKPLYAKGINLLDLPSWKNHIRLIAMPQKKEVTHQVHQVKPLPHTRAHHYQHGFDIPYKYKLKGFYNFDDGTLCTVAPHKYIEKMITNYNANLMHDVVIGRSVNPADILLIGYSQVWTPEILLAQ